MTTDNFCFHLQNRLIQTSQIGGQWYRDTSSFGFPVTNICKLRPKFFIIFSSGGVPLIQTEAIGSCMGSFSLKIKLTIYINHSRTMFNQIYRQFCCNLDLFICEKMLNYIN